MKKLINHFDRDWTPSDVEMQSGSATNLLDRVKITGILRELFIKKGSRKGSIRLTSPRVVIEDLNLSTQLVLKLQLDDLKLDIYKPRDISQKHELFR